MGDGAGHVGRSSLLAGVGHVLIAFGGVVVGGFVGMVVAETLCGPLVGVARWPAVLVPAGGVLALWALVARAAPRVADAAARAVSLLAILVAVGIAVGAGVWR